MPVCKGQEQGTVILMLLRTIVIRWEGPLSLEDVAGSDLENGLYFFAGKKKYERRDQIQYFGITKNLYRNRINDRHHALWKIRSDTVSVWLGHIEYPEDFEYDVLRLAERCLIYFWQPELNEKGKARPSKPVCIVSRWTKPGGKVRKQRLEIYRDLPDVLWWDDDEYWRYGNLRMMEN